MTGGPPDDRFSTAAIRERVLAGWVAAAVRFREDANAEEDLALGGYRDRLLVELAQNAADAATRAGVPGRLLLALKDLPDGPVLVAANTGAALDADGVEALATLRASAKNSASSRQADDDVVGRFGVGFSAVLAVTDEPAVLSRSGGVRFSAADTRALIGRLVQERGASAAGLGEELARRDGHVPVLRLPFATQGEPPAGYDTAVLLPLRDAAAEDLVVRLLADLDDTLLLALPGLDRVEVDGPETVRPRVISDVAARWRWVRRTGRLDPSLLADRPTEERRRTSWSVTWALPRDGAVGTRSGHPGVVHAPTPTDEPLPWAAVLVATFALDPTRRHVAGGPATDELVRQSAGAYAALVADLAAAGQPVWQLVPTGLPAGALDGALREAVLAELSDARFLTPARGGADDGPGRTQLLRPRDAVVLDLPAGGDAAVVDAFADTLAGLVLAPRSSRAALETLGVQRMQLVDLVEQLPLTGSPERWRTRYAALDPLAVDPLVREALSALPVPLADGRVVRGARGLVVPADGVPAEALAVLGARAVHDAAVHPLLERLGAQVVGPRAALSLPEVRAVVATSLERVEDGLDDGLAGGFEAEGTGHVDAVLSVVAAALAAGEPLTQHHWLAALALTDEDGEVAPAGELVLPGSVAAKVLDDDAVGLVDPALVARWGPDVLRATGVLDGLTVVRAADVSLTDGPGDDGADGDLDLPDWESWTATVLDALDAQDAVEVTCHEVVAVRDLDVVREESWPEVLGLLASDPVLREALVRPARVTVRGAVGGGADGAGGARSADIASWTAWWLRQELFDGRPWADPEADAALTELLGHAGGRSVRAAVVALDPAVRAALGAVRTVADLDPSAVATLLDGLADPGVEVDVATMLTIWSGLAALAGADGSSGTGGILDVDPPERVRVLQGSTTGVVDADEALVVDSPQWLQLRAARAAVVAANRGAALALADLLDLRSCDGLTVAVRHDGSEALSPVPDGVRLLLATAPTRWCEHDDLVVDGEPVQWWVEPRAGRDVRPEVVHAATLDGLARALAWSAGRWRTRHAVAALLSGASSVAELLVEQAFDD